ncbi:MAG: hypothetical protein J6C96_12590 [Oscillospiraceae bacterium]|nr:hypothetical protein [Oscillospiraceae bacterium]
MTKRAKRFKKRLMAEGFDRNMAQKVIAAYRTKNDEEVAHCIATVAEINIFRGVVPRKIVIKKCNESYKLWRANSEQVFTEIPRDNDRV